MSFISFIRLNIRWLAAGLLLTFSSSYGQTYFISLFAGEIRAEFGLTHGQWGGIYTLGTGVSALVMIWAGALTDQFRARSLGMIVLLMLSLSCLYMSFNTAAWALPFVIFALRFSGQGMLGHIAMVSMVRWFVATRGKAIAVAGLGFALGQTILPITFVALLAVYQWRNLWILAALLPLLALPVLQMLLRVERTPQSVAQGDQATGMMARHWRRSEVLKHWMFWLILPSLLGPPTFGTSIFFQQVHFTETKGWNLVDFVALMPLFTAVTLTFTLIGGWAVDRWGSARMMAVYQLPFVATFVIFGYGETLLSAALAFVLFGVMQGASTSIVGAFWAEQYGTKHVGSIKALAISVMVFGSAIGPGITGYLIDEGIIFEDQMYFIAVYIFASCALTYYAIRKALKLSPASS